MSIKTSRLKCELELEVARGEIERLRSRVESLLNHNTHLVEQRRAVERKQLETSWDSEGWQLAYREKAELLERAEREISEMWKKHPEEGI